MDHLQDAEDTLVQTQGDVSSEAHKRDLQAHALVSALIAVTQELREIHKALDFIVESLNSNMSGLSLVDLLERRLPQS